MPVAPASQTMYPPAANNVENNDVAEQRKPLISDTNTSNHGDTLKEDSDRGLVKLSTV
jgi:hypothetical protein